MISDLEFKAEEVLLEVHGFKFREGHEVERIVE